MPAVRDATGAEERRLLFGLLLALNVTQRLLSRVQARSHPTNVGRTPPVPHVMLPHALTCGLRRKAREPGGSYPHHAARCCTSRSAPMCLRDPGLPVSEPGVYDWPRVTLSPSPELPRR
jgi:hypothetical protein